jgi:hypothetical protein
MPKANLGGKICALSLSLAVIPLAGCSANSGTATAPRSPSPSIRELASNTGAAVKAPRAAGMPYARNSAALGKRQASDTASASHAKRPQVPCQLEISEEQGSMTLDFHAESVPLKIIRKEVRELAAYLNQNRGDLQAFGAPNGRPEPATFGVRKILEARPLAQSDDLIDGARLTLTPTDPAGWRNLRARVLWYAADLLPGLPLRGKVCPELPPQVLARIAATE